MHWRQPACHAAIEFRTQDAQAAWQDQQPCRHVERDRCRGRTLQQRGRGLKDGEPGDAALETIAVGQHTEAGNGLDQKTQNHGLRTESVADQGSRSGPGSRSDR